MTRGMHTLDDLRGRCVVDPDTACWHWRGAFSKGRGGTLAPVTYLPSIRKVTTCMRAAVILSRGGIEPGKKVMARCMRGDCCNPAHMMVGTQAELGAFIARSGVWKGDAKRTAANMTRMRSRSRFSIEDIQAMRQSGLNGTQLAAAHGISKSHASRILRGELWRAPEATNSSVFAWRPAA